MTSRHKSIALAVASAAATLFVSLPGLQAAPFTYNNGDLLLVFRQTGQPNLEVDIGPASQFINNSPGSVTAINQYSLTQLQAAYSNLGALNWAVIGTIRGTSVYSLAVNTLFLTDPRSDTNTQATAYTRSSSFKQGSVGNVIATVAGAGSGVGAIPWSAGTAANAISNTADVVIIPEGDASSYTSIAGSAGNLGGNFNESSIENVTPSPFSSGVTRSDFYELQPGSGNGGYLGYFEFNSSGALTFTAAGGAATNSDLAVTKVADSASVLLGSNITYTITVLNNGPALATNVVVSDVLPTEVAFVSAVTSQGTSTQSAGLVTADLGPIDTTTVATVTIVVSTVSTGLVQNTAIVSYPGDNVASNNSSTAFVTVSTSVQTNADTTPPVLAVTSPTDFETFTNSDVNVTGTATDASGIQSVTVNGLAAALNGSTWSISNTLAVGTNTLTVIATDASANQNTSTQIVHAVLSPPSSTSEHDFAITKIIAPRTVILTTRHPSLTKIFKVEFENLSTNTVVLSNLTGLVNLTVQTLGTNCPDAQVTLHSGPPQKKLPVKLKYKQRLQVAFDVVFDCANDPLQTKHNQPHDDFRSLAQIGAGEDTNTVGNVCPRPPSGLDPGCGSATNLTVNGVIHHALGADVLTDIVEKAH